jgi:hypothetical protein
MSSRNPCPDWNPHNATDANYGLNIPNSVCKRDACPYLRGVTNRGLCWFCRYTDEDGERFLRAGPNRPEERRSDLVTTDVPDTPSAFAAGSASSAAGASGAATVAPLGGALGPVGGHDVPSPFVGAVWSGAPKALTGLVGVTADPTQAAVGNTA